MNQGYMNQDLPNTSTPLKFVHELFQKDYQNDNSLQESSSKGTRFLGSKAVSILNKWFIENRDYPYPDEQTTDYLAREAEISVKQVKKWFANKRVRSQLCCKPIHRNRKSKNSNQMMNESIKYSKQQEMVECKQSNELNYSSLRLSIQQQQQQQQGLQQLTTSSLLQPALGFSNRLGYQMPITSNLNLMRPPFGSVAQNAGSSPLYGQLMLMNLIASQRQAQMQSLNLLSKFSNQSSSTTSASISSAVSNSSSNSNEDYLNDLQEEDEVESKQEGDEEEEDDDDEVVDVDESNDYRQDGKKLSNQNEHFYSMLMMMNPNFVKREQSQENDDHISSITPPPSGTSMYTTSSSSVPYISSSSSSCSSSSNNSKNTTPNTDSNKFYSAGMYTGEEKDQYFYNDDSSEQSSKISKKSNGEKKINFAIISTLVD